MRAAALVYPGGRHHRSAAPVPLLLVVAPLYRCRAAAAAAAARGRWLWQPVIASLRSLSLSPSRAPSCGSCVLPSPDPSSPPATSSRHHVPPRTPPPRGGPSSRASGRPARFLLIAVDFPRTVFACDVSLRDSPENVNPRMGLRSDCGSQKFPRALRT